MGDRCSFHGGVTVHPSPTGKVRTCPRTDRSRPGRRGPDLQSGGVHPPCARAPYPIRRRVRHALRSTHRVVTRSTAITPSRCRRLRTRCVHNGAAGHGVPRHPAQERHASGLMCPLDGTACHACRSAPHHRRSATRRRYDMPIREGVLPCIAACIRASHTLPRVAHASARRTRFRARRLRSAPHPPR